jgi:hypothetical protein
MKMVRVIYSDDFQVWITQGPDVVGVVCNDVTHGCEGDHDYEEDHDYEVVREQVEDHDYNEVEPI